MSIKCANTSHPIFKEMINRYGSEDEAYSKWIQNGFEFDKDLLDLFYQKSGTGLDNSIKELDDYLLNLFKDFGVTSKEYNNLKDKLGIDAIGATDVLNKMIYYTENRNEETIPEEIGHMAIMLMGDTNPVIKQLQDDIILWSEYDSVYNEYKDIYTINGKPDNTKIKIEAMGKLLAKSLVKNYKAAGLDTGLLEKLMNLLGEFVLKIKKLLGFGTSLYLADKIALNILLGNKDFIGKTTTIKPKLNYQEALANNPFAQDIINTFSNLNAKLVGSLAIAGQGENIYRPSEEPIHDIDFTVTSKEDYAKIQEKLKELNAVRIHDGWSNENKNYITYSFLVASEGYTVIEKSRKEDGWIKEYELVDSNGNEVKANASNSMALDFFYYENGNKEQYSGIFSSATNIYEGKLSLSPNGLDERLFQRTKDQEDFQLRNPINPEQLSSQLYFQIKSPENTTLEQINSRFDEQNRRFKKGEDGQYVDKDNNNQTATNKTASQLKKPKNTLDENDPVLKKMSEYGTEAGVIYQDILKSLYEGKVPTNTKYEDRLFEVLLDSAKETFNQIKEHQRIINLKAGTPDATFTMRFEQVLVDTKARLGGSMDVMVLFSDKTAGVLDIKTMFSRSFINAETGLIDYFVYKNDKKEQHKAQLNAYVRMLKQVIGVKDVTMIRIIPIIARYDDETDTAYLTTETKDNEILSNIVIGNEKTGIASLDKYIVQRMKVLEGLKNRRKDINRGMRNTNDNATKVEYQIELGNLNTRIKAVDASIQDAFIRKDLDSAIGSANTLKNEINVELSKDLDKIDQGKVADLIQELESIIVLEEVNFDLRTYGEDKSDEQLAKHKDFSNELNSLKELLHELKLVRDLKAIEFWKLDTLIQANYVDRLIGASKNTKMDNWFMRWLGNITDQSNPYVQLVYKKVAEFAASRDFERNEFVTELRKYATPEISKAIVNRATGTLITKLNYDASYGKLNAMPEKTDEEKLAKAKAIMSMYKYDGYNQAKVSKEIMEVLDGEFRNADGTFKTDAKGNSREREYNKQKENRLLNNLLYSITDPTILNVRGVLHLFKYRFLELKDESKYLTPEYKSLSKDHKEALEWYYKKNIEFKAMLDIREHQELPANFIPLIRKEMIDRWRDSPSVMDFVASQANFWKEDFTELESDANFGKKSELPIKFLRTSGNLNNVKDDQSYDLFDTFNAFSEFAFHYKYFSDVLPQITALKEVLIDKAIVGNKELTTESDLLKYMENIIQYSVFKVKMYKSEALEGLSDKVSMNKAINKLSNFQTTTTLGLNTMSSSASHIAGKFSAAIEGKKGNLYTVQQHTKALKDMVNNRTHYLAFCGFINVYPEADAHRLGLKPDEHHWITDNHPDKLKSYIGSRNSLLFKTWQWGEEDVTNSVTVSMGQNYGIDKNGIVRHMQFLPANSVSLYDGMSYDKETGEVKFKDNEGNEVKDNEKVYVQFRNIARAGIRNIVGTANDQDIAMYRMELIGRLAMKYKSWMPGVFLERTKQLRVNEYAQVMEIGRYRVLGTYFDEDKIRENKLELLYATANIAKDILANFVMLGGIVGQNFYKLDREKCREQFNKWKEKMREENPYELEKLEQLTTDEEKQLDLYIKAKQGQLTALLIELRVLLGLVGMTMALGLAAAGADDDDWVKSMAVKKLIRLTDKVRSEIGFFFAVSDLQRTFEKPLPILSSLGLLLNLLANTGDETRDMILGENYVTKTGKSRDNTGILHYGKQLFPGWKIGDLLELFMPEDED